MKPTYKYDIRHPARHLSVVLSDATLKPRIRRIAQQEGRTVSNWIAHHWIPLIEQEVMRQEQRLRLEPMAPDPTVPPVKSPERRKIQ